MSFALMRQRSIRAAFTFDHHFTLAGFRTLPGSTGRGRAARVPVAGRHRLQVFWAGDVLFIPEEHPISAASRGPRWCSSTGSGSFTTTVVATESRDR